MTALDVIRCFFAGAMPASAFIQLVFELPPLDNGSYSIIAGALAAGVAVLADNRKRKRQR